MTGGPQHHIYALRWSRWLIPKGQTASAAHGQGAPPAGSIGSLQCFPGTLQTQKDVLEVGQFPIFQVIRIPSLSY